MTLDAKTVLQILAQYDRDGHVEPSPRPMHLRIVHVNNDVACAVENMGGMEKACELLAVSAEQIDLWIDQHYVPEPFASMVRKHTGYSIWSLQQPTFYVRSGNKYWPHMPSDDELTRPSGICIYKRKIPFYAAKF